MQGTVRSLLWDFLCRNRSLTDTIGKPTPAFLADQVLYTKEAGIPAQDCVSSDYFAIAPPADCFVNLSLAKRNPTKPKSPPLQHPPTTMPLSIDHTTLVVPISRLDDVVKFLLATLEPLGLREWMRQIPTSVGLGDKTPFFWVTGVEGDAETLRTVMRSENFAFSAGSKFLHFPCLALRGR